MHPSRLASAEELIRSSQQVNRPHVVVLGAGASLAAFPKGDASGRLLPLMSDLIPTLGIHDAILQIKPELKDDEETYTRWCTDFEACFSELYEEDRDSKLLKQIEKHLRDYFSKMMLPEHATLYDLLILSLSSKDAVFTFNWDPLLADAWERNQGVAELPAIFHLHGNVRLLYCNDCDQSHLGLSYCVECGKEINATQLLYPIKQKDYDSDTFIRGQWDAAREYLADALLVTVFGYSAPESDEKAKEIMREAWRGNEQLLDSGHNIIKRIDVIDIACPEQLWDKWEPFQTYSGSSRINFVKSIEDSFLGKYPRRSCDALIINCAQGQPTIPFPIHQSLEDLHSKIEEIAAHESA